MNTPMQATDRAPLKSSAPAVDHLNVAIVSDAAPNRNGVGTFYVDLLEHLSSRVKRVELLSPTIDANGKWHAGLALPLPGDKTQKLCAPNPLALKRQLQELQPDIMVVATPGAYGLLGAHLAKRMGIPAVAGFHTSFEQLTELYWRNSLAGTLVHGYFKVSNGYLFRRCELVLANSTDMMDQAQKLGAKAVQLIGTIIAPVFTDTPLVPFSGDLKRVLFAGRLAPEKNIEALINTARALPHIQFSVAGDGPDKPKVLQAEEELDNFQYAGWLDREALRQQIDQHDVLVLPSHFESFGTIALEAMARQRLVVVSAGCGIADWPEFQPGLQIMKDQGLTETLTALEQLTSDERRQQADQALEVTQALNRESLAGWCQVLADISGDKSGETKNKNQG